MKFIHYINKIYTIFANVSEAKYSVILDSNI